jgi:hypothetical protein
MKEPIFNIYLFVNSSHDLIEKIGATVYRKNGSDNKKLDFLKKNFRTDLEKAELYNVPARYELVDGANSLKSSGLLYSRYLEIAGLSNHFDVFEDIFASHNAPKDPMVIITPVFDGEIKIDAVVSNQ